METTERCPLCGGPNECGMAAGQARCWCFDTTIPADLLDRIPADQRGQSCVCQSCAAAGGQPPRAADVDET